MAAYPMLDLDQVRTEINSQYAIKDQVNQILAVLMNHLPR